MRWRGGWKGSGASRFPLSEATTFRIGGPPEHGFLPGTVEEVRQAARFCREEGIPLRAVGMGSNLLVADEGVRGAVVSFRRLAGIVFDPPFVNAEAGVTNAQVLKAVRARGLGGLHCLVGYPGTIGGAVRMNAGGRPGYVGDRVEWVRGVDARGEEVFREAAACRFRYRGSDLHDLLVTEVRLRLEPQDPEGFGAECAAILRAKRVSQPMALPSAGCIWKNPPGGPGAGALVDRAGLKGLQVGDARVSEVHANFIVNLGSATCAQVRELMGTVRRRVHDHSGVLLEPEVIEWSDPPATVAGDSVR